MEMGDVIDLGAFGEWERVSSELRAASYATSLGDLTRGSISALLDAAGVDEGDKVLDVGTGPGFIALAAATQGAMVQGVDQSAEMVRIATAAGVDAKQSAAEQLPFQTGSFDAVVAGYLLNHLARSEEAVADMRRILIPGGRLAMTIWDIPECNPAIGLLSSVCGELGLTADVPLGPDSYKFADEAQMRTLLADWDDVVVARPRWNVEVAPGAWFDALADSTPRTGAVLAQADPAARAAARERYVELAQAEYGTQDRLITLPAGAVLASAHKPHDPPAAN